MPDPVDTLPKTNWGGNIAYSTDRLHQPESLDDVVRLVKSSAKLRPLGTRHTFNRIPDTDGDLIWLHRMNRVLRLDKAAGTVTVQPGITYGALGKYLQDNNFAIANYPSLPQVCVGGAVQTGTHGSGTANLSSEVVALQWVAANGEVVECSRERDPEFFDGAVVALGMLGVVTQLTLRVREQYLILQEVYEHIPLADLLANFEAVQASAYSVSFFTDWQTDRVNQVWFKRDATGGSPAPSVLPFLAGKRAPTTRHPIAAVAPDHCTEQNTPGPSHERLPHFRHDQEPSSGGAELQSEYFVRRSDVARALRAVAEIGPRLKDLMISEIRTIRADSLWLSPCYQQDSVAIHFTWEPKEPDVVEVVKTVLEPALAEFHPRPHWGKVFKLEPKELQPRFEKLADFRELCTRFDPDGKFRNDFVSRYLG